MSRPFQTCDPIESKTRQMYVNSARVFSLKTVYFTQIKPENIIMKQLVVLYFMLTVWQNPQETEM